MRCDNRVVVSLRLAGADDEDRLLVWRNDPATKAASLTTRDITRDEHRAWFADKSDDPECVILIVEDGGRPVGQVRLERVAIGVAEVSIGLASGERGRGIGREALRQSAGVGASVLGVESFRAYVRADNEASLRAFRAAGFLVRGQRDDVVELERSLTR
jgi:RimJ/RimL family protein N-acetyltransferase